MMNERIRELADQILPNEKEFHQGDPKEWGYFFSGEELEKFAELIVRECVGVCTDQSLYHMHQGQTEQSGASGTCGNLIKQRFGVE